MKRLHFLPRALLGVAAGFLASCAAQAGDFNISIGSTVEEDSPAAGAGRLDSRSEVDTYRFSATAGQLVFFEEISDDPAFKGWLRWKLVGPGGQNYFDEYLDENSPGRVKLNETGVYQVQVSVGDTDPSHVGTYSFALHAIPADSTFAITATSTVAPGQPQAGAGRIEVPGAQDYYTFSGTAGQLVFFEEVNDDPSFEGWLRWELIAPSGSAVFAEYLDGNNMGRVSLPESGAYRIRVYSSYWEMNQFGDYSFRLRAIAPDQHFAIQAGDTVSDGVPATGAGRIEMAGARDIYTFQGSVGQALFFEELEDAPEFDGWLSWELKAPGGGLVFVEYLDGSGTGRKDLAETGTYQLSVYDRTDDPSHIGAYSFHIRKIGGDTRFPLTLGQVVSPGSPGAGAGTLESPGGQDEYRFEGSTGQRLILEEISAAPAFDGWLRWELKDPSGEIMTSSYFDSETETPLTLPRTGTYGLRVYSGDQEPARVGNYSFRLYSPVRAWADNLDAAPGKTLLVPFAKFFCNDVHAPGDSLSVELPSASSAQGGLVALVSNALSYTPKAGFSGIDSFNYRIRGQWGGVDTAQVRVRVFAGADGASMVVSLVRTGPMSAHVCLLGTPSHTYKVEESTDLKKWTFKENLTASSTGEMVYDYQAAPGPPRYFRFVK